MRIDVVSGRFSKRGQIWIDIIGFVLFLLPVCFAVLWFSIPWFLQALRWGDVRKRGADPGPVYAMLPVGFSLLLLQAFSELIKRFAFPERID